jgi:S-adenosylmethionine-diacylglycerol 3-amino-3-carboxypropyl transferase
MAIERLSRAGFNLIHRTRLIYNTCWEDPRLDRVALDLKNDDEVMTITSAGCNALDYALAGGRRVYAVDLNPRQNALLELKMAGIRRLELESFFELFGQGRLENWDDVYSSRLRSELSDRSRRYWDRRGQSYFGGNGRRKSFYFRGSSGFFAYVANAYVNRVKRLRDVVDELFAARTVDEQRSIYESRNVQDTLFRPLLQWILRRDATLALLGVPRSQRRQLDEDYQGGVAQFIADRVRAVFSQLPLWENYFWRVYLTGSYTPDCCPEYLRRENFERLKAGLVDRISTHTDSVQGFLSRHTGTISHFVLLDHMDWLYSHFPQALAAEWQAIVERATAGARIIWRSAGLSVDFVDPIEVTTARGRGPVGDLLSYDRELADKLHAHDRVHTYGSFHVARLSAV